MINYKLLLRGILISDEESGLLLQRKVLLGSLAGSGRGAWDFGFQGHKFELHVGYRDYLNK